MRNATPLGQMLLQELATSLNPSMAWLASPQLLLPMACVPTQQPRNISLLLNKNYPLLTLCHPQGSHECRAEQRKMQIRTQPPSFLSMPHQIWGDTDIQGGKMLHLFQNPLRAGNSWEKGVKSRQLERRPACDCSMPWCFDHDSRRLRFQSLSLSSTSSLDKSCKLLGVETTLMLCPL